MSASQQAPVPQSGLAVPPEPSKAHSAAADGADAATDIEARANGLEFHSAPTQFPDCSTQAMVERDISSDDLQPMLDLRFPEEPQAVQLEPANQDPAVVEPMNGIADGEVVAIPTHEEDLYEAAGGTQPLNGVGYETSSDAGASAPGNEPTFAGETPEGVSQFDAGQLVPLPSVDESLPEPLHAPTAVTIIEYRGHPLDEATFQSEAEEPQAPDSDHHDATAQKIAAEASATAEALDNLKRLLAHNMPVLAPESALQRPPFLQVSSPPQLQPIDTLRSGSDEQEALVHQHQTTVDFPAAEAVANPRGGGFEFRGFLAGFALSWALGAALYVYLIFS